MPFGAHKQRRFRVLQSGHLLIIMLPPPLQAMQGRREATEAPELPLHGFNIMQLSNNYDVKS